jgi:uncharacterized alkaline shock family protein YloU
MGKEKQTDYTIHMKDNLGDIIIADEVLAVITGLAAMEVEGVAAMAGDATKELISKLGIKMLSKGVKVEMSGKVVKLEASLILKYGFNIKSVSTKVQEKVKNAVETMTGLQVADVNIRVAGIDMK